MIDGWFEIIYGPLIEWEEKKNREFQQMSQLDEANRYQPKHGQPYKPVRETSAMIMEEIWANSGMPYQPKHARKDKSDERYPVRYPYDV